MIQFSKAVKHQSISKVMIKQVQERCHGTTSIGIPLYTGKSVLTIAPLGYRKQTGLSLMLATVATMSTSSSSSEGAMTIMFGKHDIKVISNAPHCVGPSDPTKPALVITKRTGSL